MKLLLIGIGPGIGMSIARLFGRQGFEILMIARDADKLRQFEWELAEFGIRSQGYAVDIADETSFSALLAQLATEHPDLDVLHYNASAFNPAPPSAIALPTFHRDFQINTVGALIAVQAFFPAMKQRGTGAMFFTGGGSALQAPPELASLSIGKAGMRNLALCLADECAPFGIRVATVTVCGMVQPGTKHDPDIIAGEFWRLFQLPEGAWEREVMI
ncbi:MAG: SDR family NAD(P)-dependent oxidoreductase [Lewinellaceae bacterium]|nr:SDR family NAD(P)-dependent oxidoreductase [Lewinellaceae bacterium]